MKTCRTCKIKKPYSDYYKHAGMIDGYLNICKECTKSRVLRHRENNINKIREYDRKRGKLKHRKEMASKLTKNSRKNIKGYQSAHNAVSVALKNGSMDKPLNCSWCGRIDKNVEGHHPDYSKKLFVIWLCRGCHTNLHIGKNKKALKMREIIKTPSTPAQ